MRDRPIDQIGRCGPNLNSTVYCANPLSTSPGFVWYHLVMTSLLWRQP